jgi:hypothetical protein
MRNETREPDFFERLGLPTGFTPEEERRLAEMAERIRAELRGLREADADRSGGISQGV